MITSHDHDDATPAMWEQIAPLLNDALASLSGLFARRGMAVPAVGFLAALSAHAVQAAPGRIGFDHNRVCFTEGSRLDPDGSNIGESNPQNYGLGQN